MLICLNVNQAPTLGGKRTFQKKMWQWFLHSSITEHTIEILKSHVFPSQQFSCAYPVFQQKPKEDLMLALAWASLQPFEGCMNNLVSTQVSVSLFNWEFIAVPNVNPFILILICVGFIQQFLEHQHLGVCLLWEWQMKEAVQRCLSTPINKHNLLVFFAK